MRRRLAAGVAAGVLLTLTLPPLGWWPLGVVGVAVLHHALGGAGWRPRLAVGVATGVGLYAPGLWWVTEFHSAGWVAVVVLESWLLAAAVALVPGRRGGIAALVALPAALVVAEAFRGSWPFGGLPLAGVELGQVDGPLLPVARLGGHLMLVAAVGLAGVGLGQVVGWVASRRPPPGWPAAAAAVAALVLPVLASVAGTMAFDGSERGRLAVAAVQGGGPRGLRAAGRDSRPVFDAHVTASRRVSPGTDVVIWPEDVVDIEGGPLAGSPEEAESAALARELGVTLVVGVVEDVPRTRRFRNAAVVWGPDGRQLDRYEKVHRVPFGEFVPFRSLFEGLADLSAVPRDAISGRGPGVLDTPSGRLGVVISYEVFFADRARAAAAAGGRLMLVPTNASSFTTSQVPAQELAVARLRAVETGRWAVQAAPTGYSAVVDQRGRVRQRGPLGDAAVLEAVVDLRGGRTPAVRLGDSPIAAVALAAMAGSWLLRKET
ncbi:MAG: apolipoprotein N-acyltransferase [Acidimicrobiales bacterium]